MKQKAQERIAELVLLLTRYHDAYHKDDAPLVSDEVYDGLYEELRVLEEKYPEYIQKESPTQRVGATVRGEFIKQKHAHKQWSFDNVFDYDGLVLWDKKIRRLAPDGTFAYGCELKIDGVKIVAHYEKGNLARVLTRGDGVVGEDITHTASTIATLPRTLQKPVSCIVVGEAWMAHDAFTKLNTQREKDGLPPYANPRNLVAGSLRQLDAGVTSKRDIRVWMYDIDEIDWAHNIERHSEELQILKQLGFPVHDACMVCSELSEIQGFYTTWKNARETTSFDFDGIVIKIDDIQTQKMLGYTAKAPRFGVAYKMPAEEATTVIEDIKVQIGRTGALTPVAHLRPVLIDGSMVSHASLHNQDEIDRLDVRVGDTVVLKKAGDIIPQIISVIQELRPNTTQAFSLVHYAEEQGWKIHKKSSQTKEDSAAWYLSDNKNPEIHIQKHIYFVSKSGLGIDGVGEQLVRACVEQGLVAEYADWFTLQSDDFLVLDGVQEKTAQNMVEAIHRARKVTLHILVTALGIPHIGKEVARLLVSKYPSPQQLFTNHEREELEAIDGVGPQIADSFITWWGNPENQKQIHNLLAHLEIQHDVAGDALAGDIFVFTGTMQDFSREEASSFVISLGAKVSGSVSKNTTYVVAGAKGGSKQKKAEELGVSIINEKDFRELLAKHGVVK